MFIFMSSPIAGVDRESQSSSFDGKFNRVDLCQ